MDIALQTDEVETDERIQYRDKSAKDDIGRQRAWC